MSSALQAATSQQSAKHPSPTLAAALSAGDLDAATACFAREGCLLTADATAIRGREDIRPILAQMIEMHAMVEVEQRSMLISGEVALATETWTIRVDGLEHTPFAQTSATTTVMRRIEDVWKLQIAAPWGWG